MVCRRLQAGGLPEVGVETLLSRAVEAAGAWAPPRQAIGAAKVTVTNVRYDPARTSLDRHGTYIVAAFIVGTAR